MPKIVVYVRADDARSIEAIEQKPVADWVRELVQYGVDKWREQQAAEKRS